MGLDHGRALVTNIFKKLSVLILKKLTFILRISFLPGNKDDWLDVESELLYWKISDVQVRL